MFTENKNCKKCFIFLDTAKRSYTDKEYEIKTITNTSKECTYIYGDTNLFLFEKKKKRNKEIQTDVPLRFSCPQNSHKLD